MRNLHCDEASPQILWAFPKRLPAPLLLWLALLLGASLPAQAQQDAEEDDGFTNQPRGDGTVDIKATAYPVPTNGTARFVKPGGNNTQDGKSWATAWATVAQAVATAPDGATIVLKGGTYREGGISIRRKLTLQPAPNEKVWIKGSQVVSGWVKSGAQWYAPWTTVFANDTLDCPKCIVRYLPGGKTDSRGKATAETAVAANKEMVFANGIGLKQVLRKSTLGPGEFYFDYAAKRIYLAENPAGKVLEASAYERAITFPSSAKDAADGSLIRGLGFRDYAGTAVVSFVPAVTLENNSCAWNAIIGFHGGPGSTTTTLRGNTFSYNGRLGASFGAEPNEHTLIEGNVFSYNNVEGFATYHAAAGLKITELDEVTVKGNLFDTNYATGLWLDVAVEKATVVHNLVRSNKSTGIFFEACRGAIIAGNVVQGNSAGIYISGSSGVQVYNNTLIGNATNFRVKDTPRRNDNSDLDKRAAETARGIDFETREIVFKNNILADAAAHAVAVGQTPCEAQSMMQALDYNLYWRSQASVAPQLLDWNPTGCDAPTHKKYAALSEFRAATAGLENYGRGVDNQPLTSLFTAAAQRDYRLRPGSVAVGAGQALPAAVAAALGWPAGQPVSQGAKQELASPNPVTAVAPASRSATPALSAYPNPSPAGRPRLALATQAAQKSAVQVHNVVGQLVVQFPVQVQPGTTEVELPASLQKGLYYLQSRLDGQAVRFTLQVE
ncbi:right-handed parallel beta-helix repeat-containing protein [Hymenobacter weizhouensis]|uniref:right-handed parallel beta-helix repeat-containing protein n=1 Tax=Hymenobacter sp. YIM 151500-1 TaxID=2987689 RepID=UPI0022263235|nr:right-handed parallel beta-helix repeat-containing protein [Hymenobacter sp. YIM 151500-1]UYZ64950.1 right-handed parallel beta-helix repeat-containing protein [Hymenobacter sp. YIM 151500-1]